MMLETSYPEGRSAMQRGNIILFSCKTHCVFTYFHGTQKIIWTILTVNAPDGASIRELGIVSSAVFSKASTHPYLRTMVEAQNNSLCHRCTKLYLTWEGFSKHACVHTYRPLRAIRSEGWALFSSTVFTRCRIVRLHFLPPRLQLRSRYRSIVARAPKLQGRSSSLHGSHLKSLSNVVGWMQGLGPCITSAFRKHCG